MLHAQYYTDYGLAIEGLVRHHKVDPLEYNDKVDNAVPLEDMLSPDPALRSLLESIDRHTVTVWLFTNAYYQHAQRVVRLLGLDGCFDGMTFCDYGAGQARFVCKPHADAFAAAERQSGALGVQQCYFVGMSRGQWNATVISHVRQMIPCSIVAPLRPVAGIRC